MQSEILRKMDKESRQCWTDGGSGYLLLWKGGGIPVPKEEDSGMLMSSVVVIPHMCGREGGKRGPSKGTQNIPLNSEHGPARVAV